jgi:hypothetical protein
VTPRWNDSGEREQPWLSGPIRHPETVLGVVLVLVLGTGAVIRLLGYSMTAATLGVVLAAALSWVPTLLALERLQQIRRDGRG